MKVIRATSENLKKAYRTIYELLSENARVSTATISRKVGTGFKTTSVWLKEAFDKGYPGWIFAYNDIAGIKEQILKVYNKYKKGQAIKGKTPYKEYTRHNLTKTLAELIGKI